MGLVAGVLAGVSSYVFLLGLDYVTDVRLRHPGLVWLLPVAGLGVGIVYHSAGGRAGLGTGLVVSEIRTPTVGVPRRMAPLVLVGTWITHLFGGSAGREGTALQMAGSLAGGAARLARLTDHDRRVMLVAAVAGGFGAVFGVPLAGMFFALEIAPGHRLRLWALGPALCAAFVGDRIVTALGYHHAAKPVIHWDWNFADLGRAALAGLAFALAAVAFLASLRAVKSVVGTLRYPWLRPVVGGVAVVCLTQLLGHDYLGLSLPLAERALAGVPTGFSVFALKLLFTAITLGCAFPGGEVTPLFVIGSTLGAALSTPLGLPVTMAAALGFVSVFAASANAPIACTIMGAELFGLGAVVPLGVACVVAAVASGRGDIYRLHHASGAKHAR